MRRSWLVAVPLVWAVAGSTAAWAAWTGSGSATGTATATSLAAPTGVAATTSTSQSGQITVTFSSAANPNGTTYTVTRDKQANGSAGATDVCTGLTGATPTCADSSLANSTTFTYTVKAVVGSNWVAAATSVAQSTLVITSATNAGSSKWSFSGRNGKSGSNITVAVCPGTTWTAGCAGGVSRSVSGSNGNWGPTSPNTGVLASGAYVARASQGTTQSQDFPFTAP